jgi:predicted nucleic acid-binding protein
MNRVIYVETSIPSFYFETRLTVPENQARRNWTRKWWEEALNIDTLVTSQAVIAELTDTPEPKRSDCLGLLRDIPLLELDNEIEALVRTYIENKVMPADVTGDALHLALATLHECDILVSWNCRHIANVNKFEHVRKINGRLGYETPQLITPLELIKEAL